MITALVFAIVMAAGPELPEDFLVIAHRGVVTDAITENSLRSLDAAIARGYTHTEVDLRFTKDDQVVCLHDSSLKRTTGVDARIHEVTLAELHALVDADTVPSFETFCARAAGKIGLMPDIKDCRRKQIPAFAKGIQATMEKYGLMESAYFIGRKDVMDRMEIGGRRSVSPKAATAGGVDEVESYFVFGHAVDFDAENTATFRRMKLPVVVSINTFHYTDVDPMAQGIADVQAMLELGVDGLQIDSVYDEPLFGPGK